MGALIGFNTLAIAVNFFECWMAYLLDDFSIKECLALGIPIQILIILISAGAYFLTGGA